MFWKIRKRRNENKLSQLESCSWWSKNSYIQDTKEMVTVKGAELFENPPKKKNFSY